jgi:hypothetical protein
MTDWVNISRAEAIEAVRRRAGEISSERIHVFDRRFDSEWWDVRALEERTRRSSVIFWASSAPHNHELVIVEDIGSEGYLFVDVQQFPPPRLGTRRLEVMETREVNDYVGTRRADDDRRGGE